MINPHLREEIELKLGKIARHPKYYLERKKLVLTDLTFIGDVYSFWIENPELRKALLLEKRQPQTLRKEARKGIANIHNGWYYLSQIGYSHDFVEKLSPEILKRLNKLINPGGETPGEFRKFDVTLNIPFYTPPSWERVPEKIEQLFSEIKEMYHVNPLESAILAHLGVAAIQPFSDANKRCARLIQDTILNNENLPPAVIPAGEGKFYFDLLKRTLPTIDENNDGQKQFYDYCASKVNNGLDEILGDLFKESDKVLKQH